jgi:hypothetical protein
MRHFKWKTNVSMNVSRGGTSQVPEVRRTKDSAEFISPPRLLLEYPGMASYFPKLSACHISFSIFLISYLPALWGWMTGVSILKGGASLSGTLTAVCIIINICNLVYCR